MIWFACLKSASVIPPIVKLRWNSFFAGNDISSIIPSYAFITEFGGVLHYFLLCPHQTFFVSLLAFVTFEYQQTIVDCHVFKIKIASFTFIFEESSGNIISQNWEWAQQKSYTIDDNYFACYYLAAIDWYCNSHLFLFFFS